MKKSFFSLLTVAILLVASIFISQPAESITISQINLEIVAKPGETIEQLVQIYDETLSGATVYPIVYNFTESPVAEGASQLITDPAELKPDRLWVKWSPGEILGEDAVVDEEGVAEDEDEVTNDDADEQNIPSDLGQEEIPLKLPVEGNALFDFPYYIEIPQDAEPGTHLISLVFQAKPAENTNEEGAAVYIGSNVSTNIFIKVLGATLDDIDVDFKAGTFANDDPNLSPAEKKKSFESKTFFLKPPVDFLVTILNNGNTHQKPDGNIKIVNDLWGSRTEEIQVNQDNKIILPDTNRTFEVDSFGQGFMFGKYRAKITLLYGDPLRPIQKEIAFWIVPLVEILIALGIIILIIVIIIILRKSRKKKDEKKDVEREAKMRLQIIEEMKKQQPPALPPVVPAAEQLKQPRQKNNKKKVKNNKKNKK